MAECDLCGDEHPEYSNGKRYICEPCVVRQDLRDVIVKEGFKKIRSN